MPRPLALLALVGCVIGLAGCTSKPAPSDTAEPTALDTTGITAEEKAVAFVEKLGGKVTRDDRQPGRPVVVVNLNFAKVTDAGLKELAPLSNLTALYLGGTQVTNEGMRDLAQFNNLTILDLDCTKVTDPGLKEVAGLTNLQWLHLGGTWVTDAGMKELVPLNKLTSLNLRFTQVTDAGVRELDLALPNCQIIR